MSIKDAPGISESEWMHRNTTTRDLILSLDRCRHGRHSTNPCFDCPDREAVANLDRICGYGVHGTPITAADLIRAVLRTQLASTHAAPCFDHHADAARLRKLIGHILEYSAFTAGQQAAFRAEAGIRE